MISRRGFIGAVGCGGLAAAAGRLGGAVSGAAPRPPVNVLVLMTDQHHAQWLGCAGHPLVRTPNLDRLAAGGVRFTQTFAPVPYCSPTRLCLETGLYPSSLGLGRNIDGKGATDLLRLREPQRVYQHALDARGYACHQLGKWHLGSPRELACFREDDDLALHTRMKARLDEAGASAFEPAPREGETERVGEVWLRREVAEAHREADRRTHFS